VTDHGSGVAENILPNVFLRGVSGSGGSGYGLAICKENVEVHGGILNISSEKGKGTQVGFTIPSAKGDKE
jgi:signal transduction histidine kinase